MSSATTTRPNAARKAVYADPVSASLERGEGPGSGLSQRQMMLNRLWTFYTCTAYDSCRVDWDGKPEVDHLDAEVISQAEFIPPGYSDVGGATTPLKYRKPSAPYWLTRAIVNRFTGLLFSRKRHPKIEVLDDEDTEDWLAAFAKQTKLWGKLRMLRRYGGSMGSGGLGFKFVDGKPRIEVHDPRWCIPTFEDEDDHVLERFEKRYMYPDEFRDEATGEWVQANFWYRRVITKTSDTIWPRVPVPEGDQEPDWDDPAFKRIEAEHGLGFVPVVWVQNHEVQDSLDGEPDCEGIFDEARTIDALQSQAVRGAKANCDPTLKIQSDLDTWEDGVRKGSDNALQVEKGGDVAYVEITGAGPKAALETAAVLRVQALEVAQCVLENNMGGPARTDEETNANYSAMYERADELRETYGAAVESLLEMVLRAARKLGERRVVQSEGMPTQITSGQIALPPKVVRDAGGKARIEPRAIGQGVLVELKWPPYKEPSRNEVVQAVTAATGAKNGGLIDDETATRHVAPYFQVEDVPGTVRKAQAATAKRERDTADRIFGAGRFGQKAEPANQPPKPPAKAV